jgi:hypothetical protein
LAGETEVIGGNPPNYHFVGFEVLTAVVVKSSIFCDIKPCSPLKVNRRFGRKCTGWKKRTGDGRTV